jgi:sugar transferase (PEP-CTERM system associated)
VRLGSAALRRIGNPTIVLALLDSVLLVAAFFAAVAIRFGFDLDAAREAVGALLPRSLLFSLLIVSGLASMGLYRPRQRPTAGENALRVIFAIGLGGLANVLFFYVVPPLTFGRGVMAIGLAIAAALLLAFRFGVLKALDYNPLKRRVLVVGAGQMAAKVSALRRRADRRRFDVVGFLATTDGERQQAGDLDPDEVITLGEAQQLRRIDEIVVAVDERRNNLPMEFLLDRKQRGVMVSDIIDFLERETERIDLDALRPSWLLYEKSSQTDILYRWLKRVFDILFSTGLLVVTSPLLLLACVAVICEDGPRAPIFYRQQRTGRNGDTFSLLKLRSMRIDAESGSGPQFAQAADRRVTRVGRVLRRFRIDELPQLINILTGDMSVVGPRPERPEFVAELMKDLPFYSYRHCVRPGLAGWAQINFPYGASLDDAREKLKYDLYYIKNTTVFMDLVILLQTFEIVIWGRGTSMPGQSRVTPREAEPASPESRQSALPAVHAGSKRS